MLHFFFCRTVGNGVRSAHLNHGPIENRVYYSRGSFEMCTKVHSYGPVLHLSTHLENSGPPNILFHCCYTIFQIKKFHARGINMNKVLWNKHFLGSFAFFPLTQAEIINCDNKAQARFIRQLKMWQKLTPKLHSDCTEITLRLPQGCLELDPKGDRDTSLS